MYFRGINLRFQTETEYREEIERASVIIRGTPSQETRDRWTQYRNRLEKELFVLLFENICYTDKDERRQHNDRGTEKGGG